MALNRIQAARLLKDSEMEVFSASLSDRLPELSAPEVTRLLRRARSLRDKSQDLLRRQKVSTRRRTGTKGGPSGTANDRSAQKAAVFAETLQRFEKRLAQLEAAQARAARRSAADTLRQALDKKRGRAVAPAATARGGRSAKAPASPRSAAARGGPSPAHERPPAVGNEAHFRETGGRAIQGHVSSAVRRGQARRDSRG